MPLVLDELASKKKICIAQTAPAVRIAIGEELGLGVGVNATGKMVSCCLLEYACWNTQRGLPCSTAGPAPTAAASVPLSLKRMPEAFPACRLPRCAAWASTTCLVSGVKHRAAFAGTLFRLHTVSWGRAPAPTWCPARRLLAQPSPPQCNPPGCTDLLICLVSATA